MNYREAEDRVAFRYLLLIESNPDRIRSVREAAATHGIDVDVAHSTEDPASWVRGGECLIGIVIDPRLERAAGLRYIEKTRRDWPTVPILCLSSPGDSETHSRALEAGARQVLVEPVTPGQIADALASLVPPVLRGGDRVPLGRRLLVLDDDAETVGVLCEVAGAIGYAATVIDNAWDAEGALADLHPWSGIVIDPHMDGKRGLEIAHERRLAYWEHPVICLSARNEAFMHPTQRPAGIHHFASKPADAEDLLVTLRELLPLTPQGLRTDPAFARLWAADTTMLAVLDEVRRIAPLAGDVLLTSRSGADTREVARALHAKSNRRDWGFLSLDAAEIDAETLRSLFAGRGRLLEVSQGTIFLEHVHALDPAAWNSLRRCLETGMTSWEGERIRWNPRIVAATTRDLRPEDFPEGSAASAMLQRFRRHVLRVPPLRERRQDILLLAEVHRERANVVLNRHTRGFAEPALQWLSEHHFPGNERELREVVFAAVSSERGALVQSLELPAHGLAATRRESTWTPPLEVSYF